MEFGPTARGQAPALHALRRVNTSDRVRVVVPCDFQVAPARGRATGCSDVI